MPKKKTKKKHVHVKTNHACANYFLLKTLKTVSKMWFEIAGGVSCNQTN